MMTLRRVIHDTWELVKYICSLLLVLFHYICPWRLDCRLFSKCIYHWSGIITYIWPTGLELFLIKDILAILMRRLHIGKKWFRRSNRSPVCPRKHKWAFRCQKCKKRTESNQRSQRWLGSISSTAPAQLPAEPLSSLFCHAVGTNENNTTSCQVWMVSSSRASIPNSSHISNIGLSPRTYYT